MKRLFPIIFLLILFSALSSNIVFACSGGGPGWSDQLDSLIDYQDIIVIGQFVELDEASWNGIFRVESYISGESEPEYITIALNDIRDIINSRVVHRFQGGMCTALTEKLHIEGQYLFFLRKNINGAYDGWFQYFPTTESTVKLYESYEEFYELTIDELQAQIMERLDNESVLPDTEAPYPRTTPVILTTESGQDYLLPVDSIVPIPISPEQAIDYRRNQHECSTPPCIIFSRNGQDVALLATQGYDFRDWNHEYSVSTLDRYSPRYLGVRGIEGQRVSIAANSEAFVVWNNGELQLNLFWYPNAFPNGEYYGYGPHNREFTHTISVDESSLNYPAVWSADGRTLAFSDEQGLWLWDVFTENYPPQLLIPTTTEVPIARYFSPQGRYLAVSDCDNRYNLDLVTHRQYPDGYISPDDRTLLVFDTISEGPKTLEIVGLTPYMRQTEYYSGHDYYQVAWKDAHHFIAVIGGDSFVGYHAPKQLSDGSYSNEAESFEIAEPYFMVSEFSIRGVGIHYRPTFNIPYYQEGDNYYQAFPVNRFAPITSAGMISYWQNGYRLQVNDEQIDLSPYLDEPIVSAEWLPSLFYYEADWEN